MRALLRTILVIVLAVGLLAVFLRNADLGRVWTEMQSARGDLLALALVLTGVMYLVRAERWQYLLRSARPDALLGRVQDDGHRVCRVVRPAGARGRGACGRTCWRGKSGCRRRRRLPRSSSSACSTWWPCSSCSRLFFLAFSSGEAQAAPGLFRAVAWGGLALAPVGAGVLIAMFVMAGHPERLHRLVLRCERLLPARMAHAVAGFAKTFAEGLAVVRRPSRLVAALGWSLVLWLTIATQVWVLVTAFGIAMPFGGSFLLTAMLVVGVSLPTPGGVGGTHEALRLGLTSFYGADNDAAVGAAILQHAVNFVPVILLGLWFIARDGLSLGPPARTCPTSARARARCRR